MPCSRHTSRTLRSPHSPANTISSFCSGVNVQYLRFSLINPSFRGSERPCPKPSSPANRQHATGDRVSTNDLPYPTKPPTAEADEMRDLVVLTTDVVDTSVVRG